MKRYIGVKVIHAEAMNLVDAEERLGRKIHPGNEPGYLVRYADGYVSWSPKDVFEEAYRPTDGMTFGLAVEALKKGLKVARRGWNGKGMWLKLISSSDYHISDLDVGHVAVYYAGPPGPCYLPWIGMKTVQNQFVPWLASQTDVLAEDWQIVE